MRTWARLGAYSLGLVAALGGGAAVGAVAGPIDTAPAADHGSGPHGGTGTTDGHGGHDPATHATACPDPQLPGVGSDDELPGEAGLTELPGAEALPGSEDGDPCP